MLKAVIFDMDGVIIDSEPMHAQAAILALKQFHVDVTLEYLEKFIGTTLRKMCEQTIEEFHMKNVSVDDLVKANNHFKKILLEKDGLTAIPYVVDLIKNLYENGLKLIIASSSPVEAIENVMDSLEIRACFQGYISGSSVPNPKPSPDIFLAAAKKLGVNPKECIVIEDSFHGVTAAKAANMTCIGYKNPHSGNQNLRKADILVEGFDEIDHSFLLELYQQCFADRTSLSTERTIIRELTIEDIPSLYQILSQTEIQEYMDVNLDTLEEEIEKHRAYMDTVYRYYGYGLWGVFLKENNQLIGRCGIELKSIDGIPTYELGYLLDRTYQGLGYGTEAVKEVIRYSFQSLQVPHMIAIIDQNNLPSIKLACRVGMNKTGTRNIKKRDCYQFELSDSQ